MSEVSSGEKYLFEKDRHLSDNESVKTKKIDVRLDQDLYDSVDALAKNSRLSRSQVVERALLQFFGHSLAEDPIKYGSGKATPQDNSLNVFIPCKPSVGGSSTATRPSSRQAG